METPTKSRPAPLSVASRRRRLLAAAVAMLVAGCVPHQPGPQPGPQPQPPQPRIVARLYYWDAPNLIRVERAGSAIPVANGMALFENDVVETMWSYSRLDFPGTGQVWLDVNTRVRVGSLWLFFGRLFASVDSPFPVSTDDVTASPEGTRFGVRRDRQSGDYAVAVEVGRVLCTGRRIAFRYLVPAGSALFATPRASPQQPRPINLQGEIGWARAPMSGARPQSQIR